MRLYIYVYLYIEVSKTWVLISPWACANLFWHYNGAGYLPFEKWRSISGEWNDTSWRKRHWKEDKCQRFRYYSLEEVLPGQGITGWNWSWDHPRFISLASYTEVYCHNFSTMVSVYQSKNKLKNLDNNHMKQSLIKADSKRFKYCENLVPGTQQANWK